MPRQVFVFDSPERFVAGTVGAPGERTFFLQVRDGGRLVSVAMEKGQIAALAEPVESLRQVVWGGSTRVTSPPPRGSRCPTSRRGPTSSGCASALPRRRGSRSA